MYSITIVELVGINTSTFSIIVDNPHTAHSYIEDLPAKKGMATSKIRYPNDVTTKIVVATKLA